MSIASEIQALQQDKSDIAEAIEDKGVTVPLGSGFDSFAGLISDIQTGSSPILPSGYTQLTYIEGSGTQIIDCDYDATFDTKYECEVVANSSQGTIYAVPFSNHGHMQLISSRYPDSAWYTVFGNSSEKTLAANAVNARVIISLDKTQCVIYGEYAYGIIYSVNMGATADTTGTYNRTCLFGRIDRVSGNFDRLFKGRIFNFKIYENNQLAVNMIPCIKDSNQEVGMYDIVRDRFFGNIGTGSFTGYQGDIPTGKSKHIETAEYTPSIDTKTFSINYPKTLTGWKDKPMFIYCFAEEVPQRSDTECVTDFGMLAAFGGAKTYQTGVVETRKTNGTWEWYTAEKNNRLLLTFDWSTGIINVDTSNQSIFTFAAGIKYKFYFIESVVI